MDPPAHLLDLRARVRCRHTLLHQRTEWQQRMQAVLYHHGAPHARGLLKLENRERLQALALPAAAHEQLTIALAMIDAIEVQLGPFDLSLRQYARKQPGCRTLIDQIYGIGELTSVTILAELGDTRRFQNSRDAVATAAWNPRHVGRLLTDDDNRPRQPGPAQVSESVAGECFCHLGAAGADYRCGDLPVVRPATATPIGQHDSFVANPITPSEQPRKWKRSSARVVLSARWGSSERSPPRLAADEKQVAGGPNA